MSVGSASVHQLGCALALTTALYMTWTSSLSDECGFICGHVGLLSDRLSWECLAADDVCM